MKPTTSPNPAWKPKDKILSPVGEMVVVDPKSIKTADMYKLLIGSIIPRPIAFISTEGADESRNLAPFSFFNGVSSKPPCLVFSVSQKPSGEKKDTLKNIEETGEFVVNSANEWFAEALAFTSSAFPYGVDEMELVGLTPLKSLIVKPPRVKESAIQFECKVHKTVAIGDGGPGSATLVIGEVLLIHIDKRAYKDGKISFSELAPMSRLGGYNYGRITEFYELRAKEI